MNLGCSLLLQLIPLQTHPILVEVVATQEEEENIDKDFIKESKSYI